MHGPLERFRAVLEALPHQPIRELVHPHPVITIHMAFEKGDLPANTDMDFLESSDMDEAAKLIVKKMEEMEILL